MSTEVTKPAEAAEVQPEETTTVVAAEDETADESATSKGDTETEVPSDEEVDEQGKPKQKLSGYERRIRRLSTRITAAEDENAYLREQLASRGQQPPKAEVQPEKPKPKPEDFILDDGSGQYNHAAFTEAMADWKAEQIINQRLADQEAKAKQAQAQTEAQRVANDFKKREGSFADAVDDYGEVADVAIGTWKQLASESQAPALDAISGSILESDHGPELLYYLGQNPDEAERIAKLSPTRAVMALGQLEAQLAEQEPEKGKEARTSTPVSHAPEPITPIKKPSGSGVKYSPDDPKTADKMTTDEWLKARREQVRHRAQGRR